MGNRIMRRLGRPCKSSEDSRYVHKTKTLRLTDEETKVISDNALKCRMNFSEYCRKVLLGYRPCVPYPVFHDGLFAARKDMVNFINAIRGMKLTKEESAYRYSHRSRTDANQSMEHQLKIFLLPGKWQIEWTNELYHSNDNSVSTNYFSDLSISYRTKTYEIGMQCSNLFGTREYRRHYTTSYTDVIVQNQLRPRDLMFRVIFNI